MIETTTTTDVSKPNFKVAIALDTKTIIIFGIVVFVALLGALIIYKKS